MSRKRRWAKHFENLLSRDRLPEKDIEKTRKVCDILDLKEY